MPALRTFTRIAQPESDPPIVVSTFPDSSERNVFLNSLVKVTFNQQMLSTSITDTTFLVVKQDTYTPVDCSISYDVGTRTVTLTPTEYLDADSTYIGIIVGNQDEHARVLVGVKNIYSEPMVGNYSWQFYTGFSVSSDPDLAALASGTTGYEPPQDPDPSGIFTKDGYLTISWTEPENYDTNVPISGTIIQIQLSDSLEIEEFSGLGQMVLGEDYVDSTEDYLNYYISIENNPSLGDPMVSSLPWEYDIYYDYFTNKVTASGKADTVAVNGYYNSYGIWSALGNLYGVLEENNEYIVTIKEGLAGLNTYPLQSDYVFMFTTIYDPLFSTVMRIRLNIGTMIRNIPDDTINRLIHENSILAQRLYPLWAGIIPANDIPYYVSEFVTCKTKLDVLNAAMLDWAGSGGTKTLADLSIEKASPGRDIRLLADKKISELEKCIAEMLLLVEQAGVEATPDYAIIGKNDSRRPITDRSWRRLPKLNPDHIMRPGTVRTVDGRARPLSFGRESQTGKQGRFIR